MVTVWKSRAASWVRNGKPAMFTCGLPDRSSDDWNWLANWFSVYALATRSPTTSTTMITITVITAIRGPRRRLATTGGGGPWGGRGCCHQSGTGWGGSALMTGLPMNRSR